MKIFHKTILVLLISNFGFPQSSKIIHNKDGLSVIYLLSKIGNQLNSESGTNFTKYNLHLIVKNSSSKYWAYNAINSINSKNIKSGIVNSNDERFMRNGGFSTIDHFCIEDNCVDFPRYNSVAAPHQVICPSGIQECEKTFLYPTDVAGEPEIEWTSWGFVEMLNNDENNKQNTISSKSKIGQPNKVISKTTQIADRSFAYKGIGVRNLLDLRKLLTQFIEANTVVPKIANYAGDRFVINFGVNENGKIVDAIAYGKYPELNDAAIKALQLSEKDWTIEIKDGKKVSNTMGTSVGFAVACGAR